MAECAAVESVIGYVRAIVPDVSVQQTLPTKPDGIWWAVFEISGCTSILRYQEHLGLSVTFTPPGVVADPECPSDERFSNAASAAHRVIQILHKQR